MGLAADIAGAWAPILQEVSLRGGTRGRFEVVLDDGVLFSKTSLRRFPKEGEVVDLARRLLGPPIQWR